MAWFSFMINTCHSPLCSTGFSFVISLFCWRLLTCIQYIKWKMIYKWRRYLVECEPGLHDIFPDIYSLYYSQWGPEDIKHEDSFWSSCNLNSVRSLVCFQVSFVLFLRNVQILLESEAACRHSWASKQRQTDWRSSAVMDLPWRRREAR